MNPHQHLSNNDVLGAPPGVPIDQCAALPITRVIFTPSGQHAVASYWLPTAEELQLLNAGQAVRLSVVGRTHPPVYVGVDGDGLI
jgi:hypothetical protein